MIELFAPLLLAVFAGAPSGLDVVSDAQAHLKAKRFDEAALVLANHLKTEAGSITTHELYAKALSALERKDEAAFHLEEALILALRGGTEKEIKSLSRSLSKADPLARKRESLVKSVVKSFGQTAEKLFEQGHGERALDLVERILPDATGKERAKLSKLREDIRSTFEEVEFDSAGDDVVDRDLVVYESEFYKFEANLEREVVEQVGITMDDVFRYFVELYFEGSMKRVSDRKVTIRIHEDHASMVATYPGGGGAGIGGWWSPGEWKIVVYDTRSRGGSLKGMLTTLLHEASHHFMTMFSSGSGVPSWLNEGTSCFFEGAVVMADHRVLWPDAARSRLSALTSELVAGTGPTLDQVVGFTGGGSYPGQYYPYGWGLIYFLQQYEDPTTLEYVWRPYYSRYRDEILGKREQSRKVFEEVLLEKGNPGGYREFDRWISAWKTWITGEIFPLHFGRERIERRKQKLDRYLKAADGADPGVTVDETELLLRALKQIDFLRKEEGDDPEAPDLELALLEIDVLERLDRKGSAASRIERLLGWADEERLVLEAEAKDALESRMQRLDRRNAPLRTLRMREKSFRKRAANLLAQYEEEDRDLALRGYTFARRVGRLLADADGLLSRTTDLRQKAVALGRIPSRVLRVEGENWVTVFPSEPKLEFDVRGNDLEIRMPGRPAGRISEDVVIDGSAYELRATLTARGKAYRSSYYGLVIAGGPARDWFAVTVDGKGALNLRQVQLDSSGAPTSRRLAKSDSKVAPEAGEKWELAVRVESDGAVRARLGEFEWNTTLPVSVLGTQHVGVLVKDGDLRVRDLLVEVFP